MIQDPKEMRLAKQIANLKKYQILFIQIKNLNEDLKLFILKIKKLIWKNINAEMFNKIFLLISPNEFHTLQYYF